MNVSRFPFSLLLGLVLAGSVLSPITARAQTNETTEAATEQVVEAPANEFERWMGRLSDAGATVPAMLLLSVLGVSCILERAVHLRRGRIAPPGLTRQLLPLYAEDRFEDIEASCAQSNCTLGRVVSFLAAHRHWKTGDLTDAAGDIANRELRRHLLKAYPLAIIGALAPLLGLLGTVSGMVDAFDSVAVAGLGDVGVLGTSISKALVTTMVGLVVAIPALFAYHIFKSRTQLFGVVLEEEASDLIHAWFMPGQEPEADKEDRDVDARQA